MIKKSVQFKYLSAMAFSDDQNILIKSSFIITIMYGKLLLFYFHTHHHTMYFDSLGSLLIGLLLPLTAPGSVATTDHQNYDFVSSNEFFEVVSVFEI